MKDDTVNFSYRCRQCGKTYNGGSTNSDNAVPYLVRILHKGSTDAATDGNVMSLHDIHHCNTSYVDPQYGVADLIGVLPKCKPWKTPLLRNPLNRRG